MDPICTVRFKISGDLSQDYAVRRVVFAHGKIYRNLFVTCVGGILIKTDVIVFKLYRGAKSPEIVNRIRSFKSDFFLILQAFCFIQKCIQISFYIPTFIFGFPDKPEV